MKGVVFNLLQTVVSNEFGEETWDTLLESAGLEGAYTALGSYPNEELATLVETASAALGKSADWIVRWFGRKAIAPLADIYPQFFTPHKSTRSFLLTLNDVIHPEVRKLYPGADVPVFEYETMLEDLLVMSYTSPRKLCRFGEGLIEGAAVHFGEIVQIDQLQCMDRGDRKCMFQVVFNKEQK